MTYERDQVEAALREAQLDHLLKTHALAALRDAQRQVREASEQVGRVLEGAGASAEEKATAAKALGDILATLTVGSMVVAAQSCNCAKDTRVTLEPSAEEIERAFVEKKPLRKLVIVRAPPRAAYEASTALCGRTSAQEYAGAHSIEDDEPGGAA